MTKEEYRIYTLSDPFTGQIKYVGKTINSLAKRLALHCNSHPINRKRNPAKYDWAMELRTTGRRPEIELLEVVYGKEAAIRAEIYWTFQIKAWGFSLFNRHIGNIMSTATKAKMAIIGKTNRMVPMLHVYAKESRKRPVFQLSTNGSIIAAYEFIITASRKLGIDRSDITKCCKGGKKTAGGFTWQYCTIEEYNAYIQKQTTNG